MGSGFLNVLNLMSYVLLAMWVLPIFPLLYVIVRWRSGEGTAGTGTHAALFYFATVSFLIALAGGANLVYGAISVTPVDEEMTRISWGMLSGALVFCALNVVMMRSAGNVHDSTDVERVFVGFLMVTCGMIALGALVLTSVALFREAASDHAAEQRSDQIRMFGVWTLFFLVTYLMTTRVLARNALLQRTGQHI